jgi:tRNA threonylcarbamoyladenosine biosynthesis protein TsaE
MIIKSLDHLQLISKKIADKISEKDCIFLIGEIGVGKTTFTRNLINYFQKKEGVEQTQVLSPTFNLLYEYDIKNFKVMHYDLYRIKNSKELDQLGIFNENANSIKIIEWPQLIEINITDRLELHLSYASNENERRLILEGVGKWKEFNLNEL